MQWRFQQSPVGGDEMADVNVVTSKIALVGVPKARPLQGGPGACSSGKILQRTLKNTHFGAIYIQLLY